MDSYQAVYDATRSRINPVNTHDVVERAAREAFDMGNARAMLIEQIYSAGNEMVRPSAIYRPRLLLDGTKWCALYGDNLMDGVAGFGDTPAEAMAAFDLAWTKERTPAAIRAGQQS
jgi:hypothetical protein